MKPFQNCYNLASVKNSDQDKYDKWHDDPENWKFGIFYFNKEDKRIFPPKRISWLGWTINFGNPKSILGFTFILLIITLTILFAH